MKTIITKTLAYQQKARLIYCDNTEMISLFNSSADKGIKDLMASCSVLAGLLSEEEVMYVQIHDVRQIYKVKISGQKSFCHTVEPQPNPENHLISVRRENGYGSGFTGILTSVSEYFSKNMQHYYNKSEQCPTAVNVLITSDCVRAFLLQLLPHESNEIIKDFHQKIHAHFDQLTDPAKKLDDQLVSSILGPLEVMAQQKITYTCSCCKEMFYGLLFAMSKAEVISILKEKQTLTAQCKECGKHYEFTSDEISILTGYRQ